MRLQLNNLQVGDIVITNRDIVPELRTVFFEKLVLRKGAKLIFDFDDAIFLGARRKKLNMIIPLMNHVVAGNTYLAKYAKELSSSVDIIPTVVNTELYALKTKINDSKFVIGWSGSDSTAKVCLPLIRSALEELNKKMDFVFLIISSEDPKLDWSIKDIRFKKWTEETEVEGIAQMDVGLMPLNDTEFERGKCGLKAIQYMATGIPAVVSPVGMNETLVEHQFDGFHAKNTSGWVQALEVLAANPTLRKTMGKRGRAKIEKAYSLHYAVNKWTDLIENRLS